MDYEKAYKQALERAREIYHRGYYVSGDIEHIFPELKESEDERIRKDIISYLQRKQNQGELDAPDWIAWLEKQVSPKMVADAYLRGCNDTEKKWLEKQGTSIDVDSILNKVGIQPAYKDGNAWCILYGDNLQDGICGFGDTKEDALVEFIKELLENQGMQKSSIRERYDRIKDSEWFKRTHKGMSVGEDGEMKTPEESLGIDSETYNKSVDECIYDEQKPTWSDTDKLLMRLDKIVDCNIDQMKCLNNIFDKLNEVIGKLGDIHEVLSKPYVFPYKDYTPPQEPWYKTHGVEKVTPVTCKTISNIKKENG